MTDQQPNERLNPNPIYLTVIVGASVVSAGAGIVALVAGAYGGGLFWLALAAGLTLFLGVVDLSPEGVAVRKIYGTKVIGYDEIADVGLAFRRAKRMKWWMPKLTLHDGKVVKVGVLSAPLKKLAIAKCERIVAMAGEGNRIIEEERQAALQTDGPLFTPLAGLEQHYNVPAR